MEMCSAGREDLFLRKQLCKMPFATAEDEDNELWDCSEPDPQPSSQKKGEALSPLTAFGSQAGRTLSLYWLDLAPAPTPATFVTHIFPTEILQIQDLLLPTGVGVVKWGDVPMRVGLVARTGCWQVTIQPA